MNLKTKIVAGTVAASVVLGGGFVGVMQTVKAESVTSNTYSPTADSNVATAPAPTQKGKFGKGFEGGRGGKHGGEFGAKGGIGKVGFVTEAATILGLDQQALLTELQGGKTLLAIAQEKGLTEESFLQKLTDAVTVKIDAAVAAGTMTQAQADQVKAGLAEHLKADIASNRLGGLMGKQGGRHGGHGMLGNPEEIAAILGITADELHTALESGKSLTEIAESKGITKDQLVSKLKDNMTSKIETFVDQKGGLHKHRQQPALATPSTTAPAATN